jgi:mono/diheme cytochrome c family protein
VLAYTWDGGIDAIFQTKCSLCHGSSGGFSVKNYGDIIQGGDNGLTIIPGNPEDSKLLSVAAPGSEHPGQFTEEELEKVRIWILNGAIK